MCSATVGRNGPVLKRGKANPMQWTSSSVLGIASVRGTVSRPRLVSASRPWGTAAWRWVTREEVQHWIIVEKTS
jgi:hypothetical protein